MKLAALAMLALSVPVLAQDPEKYDLGFAGWKAVEGHRSRFTRAEQRTETGPDDAVSKSSMSVAGHETITRALDGRAMEVAFTFDEADWTVAGKPLDVPFRHRTIRVTLLAKDREVRPASWRYELGTDMGDEVELMASALRGFEPRLGMGDLLPKKPVAIGESWPAPVAWFLAEHQIERKWLSPRSSVKGTLKRVFGRDGARFAQIVVDADLVLVETQGLRLENPARLRDRIDIEACIDGSRPDATLVSTGEFTVDSKVAGGRIMKGRIEHTLKLSRVTLPRDERKHAFDVRWKAVVGHRAEVHENEAASAVSAVTRGGAPQRTEVREATCFTGVRKVLRVADGRPAEWTWTFSKAEHRAPGTERKALPLQGKTIRGTRDAHGARSFVREDGKELGEAERNALDGTSVGNVSGMADPFLPSKPTAVGESWAPDWKALDPSADPAKCRGTLTLKSVEERNGSRFARIEGSLEISMAEFQSLTLETPAMMRTWVEATLCIDGTLPDGEIEVRSEIEVDSACEVNGVKAHLAARAAMVNAWYLRTLK